MILQKREVNLNEARLVDGSSNFGAERGRKWGWGFPGSRPLEQRLALAAAGLEAVIESTWCACWTRFWGAR